MIQRTLITGISGFTGRYVATLLRERGHDVCGLGQFDESPNERMYVCDLSDAQRVLEVVRLVQPTHVVHLAAISFVAHDDVAEVYKTNIIGTRNLLAALASLDTKPKKVLLASSANIYGNVELSSIDERVTPCPNNDYAVSKYAMEGMARLWFDKLPIIIITRPFNYTGVGQSGNFIIPKIVNHFRNGSLAIELGNIDVDRDFTDVRTVASVYADLLECDAISGEIFNVCAGKTVSLRNVIEAMEGIAGYDIEVKVNQAFVRENEIKRLCGSNEKLVKAIGKLDEFSLKATLKWMYETDAPV